MRVCMVCPTYPPNRAPCGVGDYTRELAEQLTASGVSLTVLASTAHRQDPRSRVPVVPLADQWDAKALAFLVRMARQGRFDLLHMQYTPELFGRRPWMKFLPAALVLSGGPRVVLTPHTLVGGYPSAKFLAPLLVGFSRRIICPNDEVADLLGRYLPPLRSRLRRIPIGSNVPGPSADRERARAGLRAEFGLTEDTAVLAHFGFAYAGKGMETLLAAGGHLRAWGIRFVLLMIGGAWPGAEPYLAELQARGRAAGLGGEIVWLGHCARDRVADLLAGSDIYVAPYDEGVSTRRGTLQAALLHRLPVVGTQPSRPSRWFRDGQNVVLIPPRDPQALAAALRSLILSPDLRERLSRASAALAEEFSWPRIAAATAAVYQEVRP